MAKNTKKASDLSHQKSTFSEILFKVSFRFSLHKVFDDFLTMAIAACTQNIETKVSYYEDEYLETIAYYKDSDLRFEFPNAFAALILEMEERVGSSQGNDVLGDFFEQNISNGRNGQFFTPAPVCDFMASILHTDTETGSEADAQRPLRILDPACGSGHMLLSAYKQHGNRHQYYGIDVDRTCVKMAAVNLFLNGIWRSEVLCADALKPNDFVIAYRISFMPLGIFKIEEKEQCLLWHMHQRSFDVHKQESKDSTEDTKALFVKIESNHGTQLDLF